jgi:AraC-like DNA-binding protein
MSISVALVVPLLEIAERAGAPFDCVLARAGVERRLVRDAFGRLTHDEYERVVESAIHYAQDPLLGIHAGTMSGATFSPAGHAAICAPTPRAGLEAFFRYQPLLYDGARSRLSECEGTATLTMDYPRVSARVDRVTSEACVARMLRGAEAFGDRQRFSLCVSLEHAPAVRAELYAEALGCEVRFEQEATAIAFPRALLDRPARLTDRHLFQALSRHAERCLETARKESLARDVESVIQQGVVGTHPDTENVARALSLSPQDFRRLLRERGYSFRTLLDEARKSLAERLLLDVEVSVKDAAYRLGFSDPSAFNRAVRRWTGQTPLEYRRMRKDTLVAQRLELRASGQSMGGSHQVI